MPPVTYITAQGEKGVGLRCGAGSNGGRCGLCRRGWSREIVAYVGVGLRLVGFMVITCGCTLFLLKGTNGPIRSCDSIALSGRIW